MYSLLHSERYKYALGYVRRSRPSEYARLAAIALLKSQFIDIYRRNFVSKSLTKQKYELASQLYETIKKHEKLTDSYIDIVWLEIQKWDVN